MRYVGLDEVRKFAQAAGNKSGVEEAKKRIDEPEMLALGLGFGRVQDRRSKRIGVGQVMRKPTNLIKSTLGAEADYRLLSAMAHAQPNVVFQLGFCRVEGLEIELLGKESEQATAQVLEKSLSPDAVVFLAVTALDLFAKPVRSKCELYGWEMGLLDEVFTNAFSVLGRTRADYWLQ